MNNYSFSQSDLIAFWNHKGNRRYSIRSFICSGNSVSHLILEDKDSREIVSGKIVSRFSDGEFYHWPCLHHRSLLSLLEIVPINYRDVIFLTPYYQKSLRDIIHEEEFVSQLNCYLRKKVYIEDVLWAMDYLHRNSLCLMNLSDDKVFICERSSKAVVSDFSCLTKVEKASPEKFDLPLLFRAPEINVRNKLTGQAFSPMAVDIWSAGVMILEIFLRHMSRWALINYDPSRVLEAVESIDFETLKVANAGSNLTVQDLIDFKSFIGLFFNANPSDRCSPRYAATTLFLQAPKHRVNLGLIPPSPRRLTGQEIVDNFEKDADKIPPPKPNRLQCRKLADGSLMREEYSIIAECEKPREHRAACEGSNDRNSQQDASLNSGLSSDNHSEVVDASCQTTNTGQHWDTKETPQTAINRRANSSISKFENDFATKTHELVSASLPNFVTLRCGRAEPDGIMGETPIVPPIINVDNSAKKPSGMMLSRLEGLLELSAAQKPPHSYMQSINEIARKNPFSNSTVSEKRVSEVNRSQDSNKDLFFKKDDPSFKIEPFYPTEITGKQRILNDLSNNFPLQNRMRKSTSLINAGSGRVNGLPVRDFFHDKCVSESNIKPKIPSFAMPVGQNPSIRSLKSSFRTMHSTSTSSSVARRNRFESMNVQEFGKLNENTINNLRSEKGEQQKQTTRLQTLETQHAQRTYVVHHSPPSKNTSTLTECKKTQLCSKCKHTSRVDQNQQQKQLNPIQDKDHKTVGCLIHAPVEHRSETLSKELCDKKQPDRKRSKEVCDKKKHDRIPGKAKETCLHFSWEMQHSTPTSTTKKRQAIQNSNFISCSTYLYNGTTPESKPLPRSSKRSITGNSDLGDMNGKEVAATATRHQKPQHVCKKHEKGCVMQLEIQTHSCQHHKKNVTKDGKKLETKHKKTMQKMAIPMPSVETTPSKPPAANGSVVSPEKDSSGEKKSKKRKAFNYLCFCKK